MHILPSLQNNLKKEKECDAYFFCENINEHLTNGKNICVISIRTVIVSKDKMYIDI